MALKFLDFESRSRADLRVVGGRNYWEHPSTEAICCAVYDLDRDTLVIWRPGMPDPIGPEDTVTAHNWYGFDRFGAMRYGWRWGRAVDTAQRARQAGLPGALDALGTRLLGTPKDDAGSALTRALSGAQTRVPEALRHCMREYRRALKSSAAWPVIPRDVYARVEDYNMSDVDLQVEIWPHLRDFDFEQDVIEADAAINDRGILFDSALAKRLLEEDEINAAEAMTTEAAVIGCSPSELRAWVSSPKIFCECTGLPNAKKITIARALAAPDTHATVRAACRARQALASIARGKLRAGLARVSPDGRLRDNHFYYAAHTGRWGGRGMQLQNMPSPSSRFDKKAGWDFEDTLRLVEHVMRGGRADAEQVNLLLRACLYAPPGRTLVTADYKGVEARGLAWCAGDADALRVFRELDAGTGPDPYRIMASAIFSKAPSDVLDLERRVGKVAELACGYGMGAAKFEATARNAGVDLRAIGLSGNAVVQAWRRKHAPIVRFWGAMQRAFASAVGGREARVDRFVFTPAEGGDAVAMWLPSGRPIVYHEPRVSAGSISYAGNKGVREHLYGGKIAENAIQAMCRDFTARALVRVERAGMRPVLHVHDSITCEGRAQHADHDLALLEREMLAADPWAENFPLGVDGHHGTRYSK